MRALEYLLFGMENRPSPTVMFITFFFCFVVSYLAFRREIWRTFLADSEQSVISYGRKSTEVNVQAESVNAFSGLN